MTDQAIAIPVLASLDLAQSKYFYEEKLGFKAELFGDYMIAKRDSMEIHFWLANDRIHPEHTSWNCDKTRNNTREEFSQ